MITYHVISIDLGNPENHSFQDRKMDNTSDKNSTYYRQMEDENEHLKHELMRANNLIQQLQRENDRMKSLRNNESHSLRETENNHRNYRGQVVVDSVGQISAANFLDQQTPEGASNEGPNQNSECEPIRFEKLETLSWCEERRREIKNSNDKRRLQHYLCRAISKNSGLIASYLSVIDLFDPLLSHGCVTEDEYRSLRHLKDSTNLGRVILPLILKRDCKTLLSFIHILFESDTHIAIPITQEYDNVVKEDDYSVKSTGPMCSHCLLVQRVEPVLVIDFILGHDYSKWLPFYEQAANCRYDAPEKKKAWWDDFIVHVNKDRASAEMTSLIINALEACGFHSDIVENLRDDQKNKINSYVCKIDSSGDNPVITQGAEEVPVYEPRMQLLKEVDDENTILKMIQNTKESATPMEEHKLEELKLFDSDRESYVGTEQPDESRQNENTYTNGPDQNENISLLFISNSNVTIKCTSKNS